VAEGNVAEAVETIPKILFTVLADDWGELSTL
jgi:hypothetical protein